MNINYIHLLNLLESDKSLTLEAGLPLLDLGIELAHLSEAFGLGLLLIIKLLTKAVILMLSILQLGSNGLSFARLFISSALSLNR